MAICAVNYPTFSSEDYEWIQSIRRKHDALFFDVVPPHFTLVFPTENIGKSEFIAHITEVAERISPFDVVLRCAILGDTNFMNHAHAFLVPDEGFSDVVRLHDALYTGLLQAELRLDLPFIPHIRVASTPHMAECKSIVDDINSKGFEIHARVEKLDIIGYDGSRIWTIEKCTLY